MPKHRSVGIDLGTTYSAVAWVEEPLRTRMVTSSEGGVLTPSVVLFDDDEVVVGKEAKRVSLLKPDRVAETVKRDIGEPFYSRPIRGEYLPPEVIQACILRKLKADVVRELGPAHDIVITVPAFFDERRRRATWQAGEIAGLNVLDIVNEPTAAALAFGEEIGYLGPNRAQHDPQTLLVYDLGGGTFDITIVRLSQGSLETIATDGDVRLGGHDWDQRLVDHAADVFLREHRADPRHDPVSLQRLFLQAEEVKHTLSTRQQARLRVEHGGKQLDVEVTREDFERLTADLLERTRTTTRQLLTTAGMDWSSIDRVLLTGGSTRMPMVAQMLAELTGRPPDRSVSPDEAVARGAALYAWYRAEAQAAGTGESFRITNVNSHSLGVEGIEADTTRKLNVILIPKNTPLPKSVTKYFVTKVTGQQSIVIRVLEGESSQPKQCTELGRAVIRGLPPGLPAGTGVEVTYAYAVDGRLHVEAEVWETGDRATLEIERDTLSDKNAEKWKGAVQANAGLNDFEKLVAEVLDTLDPPEPAGPETPTRDAGVLRETRPEPTTRPIPVKAPSHTQAVTSTNPTFESIDEILAPTSKAAPAPAISAPQPNPAPTTVAQPYNQPIAQTYAQPLAQPYGQPMAQPYGQPMPQPYSQPMAQPYGQPVAAVPAAGMGYGVAAPPADGLHETGTSGTRSRQPVPKVGPIGILIGYLLSVVVGGGLGYYVLCCFDPARFNRFDLPLIQFSRQPRPPAEAGSDGAGTEPAPASGAPAKNAE